MENKDVQFRGHCQICGRVQAVVSGVMSKHGYTVEYGWFNGVCDGREFEPIEVSRERLDITCHRIIDECSGMESLAIHYRSGSKHPDKVASKTRAEKIGVGNRRSWHYPIINWDEANNSEQRDGAMVSAIKLEDRAQHGRSLVADLRKLADKVYGTPLKEVSRDRMGPKLHLKDPRFPRYTKCNQRIAGTGSRARYLYTVDNIADSNCDKCRGKK